MKSTIKTILTTLTLVLALSQTSRADSPAKPPFDYPAVPDSLQSLQERTSYLMTHFWDAADMKQLKTDTAGMRVAVSAFIDFIPYAHADTVRHAITRLMGYYAGQPATLLHIADIAEDNLVGPDADFWSETTYMQFLRPVLTDKKVKQKDKEPLLAQIKKYNSSIPGAIIQDFSYVTRHGARHNLYSNDAPIKLLLLEPDDCSDCSFNRLRLQADVATCQLIKDGQLKIVLIRSGKPDADWDKAMADQPYQWEIGTSPDVDKLVDTRLLPGNYVLDQDNKIVMRNLTIDQLLNLSASLYRQDK